MTQKIEKAIGEQIMCQKTSQHYRKGLSFSPPNNRSWDKSYANYHIVGFDQLIQSSPSQASTWVPKVLPPAPKLARCQKCHQLGANHFKARLALTLFNICTEPALKGKVCRGLDSLEVEKLSQKNLHNILFGTKIELNNQQKQGLIDYGRQCIGRYSGNHCPSEPLPGFKSGDFSKN